MTTRGHFTAGDLTPMYIGSETTYGQAPIVVADEYGSIAEGGGFQPTDNPNPHMTWRYGSRAYNRAAYVTQQNDAGFRATFEALDAPGVLHAIIGYAVPASHITSLPSKTLHIREGPVTNSALQYVGCKTEELTISADVPGGIVTFEETVFASYSDTVTMSSHGMADAPAIQWTGGIILGNSTYYPQSFKLTIRNNLSRVYGYDPDQGSITKALLEGKEEIEFEMTLWMEDLTWLLGAMKNETVIGNIVITMGTITPRKITLTGLNYVADGSNTSLIQDKQLQTVRFRATGLTEAAAE